MIGGTLAEPPQLHNLVEISLEMRLTPACLSALLSAKMKQLIEFDQILVALRPCRNTLKEPTFILHRDLASRVPEHVRGVELIREFQTLEVLQVQTVCFAFGARLGTAENALTSALPASIRGLRLFGYGDLRRSLQVALGYPIVANEKLPLLLASHPPPSRGANAVRVLCPSRLS
ncbi:hypothetical protein N657DRAFT_693205 [Parathielavia appendiculata]|uniref:Uncharacterized protein n=1 Tax=Parathielavia appendiculata TaxID=2587402 RepID=A0AAN6TT72_9PEZI|nr:hypothetical protein N657DRAFT_693205 [Parathielavia appendiculata]